MVVPVIPELTRATWVWKVPDVDPLCRPQSEGLTSKEGVALTRQGLEDIVTAGKYHDQLGVLGPLVHSLGALDATLVRVLLVSRGISSRPLGGKRPTLRRDIEDIGEVVPR